MLKIASQSQRIVAANDTSLERGTNLSRRHILAGLTGVLMVAAVSRVYTLGAKSIWLDEAFSIFVARQSFDRMLEIIVQHDTPPPLYYSLLHIWIHLTGDDPFSARLLSAVLGVFAVGAMFLFAREVANSRIALTAAALMAVSPFQVWYGQEARMYTLLAFTCTLSVYFLIRALKHGGVSTWTLYVVASSLALYTQISAAFFLCGQAVAAVLFLSLRHDANAPISSETPPSGSATRTPALETPRSQSSAPRLLPWRQRLAVFRPWFLSQIVIVLLWLPWLPNFIKQSQTYQEFWLSAPTPHSVTTLFFELTSAYLPHWRLPGALELLLLGATGIIIIAAWRLQRPECAFLLALLIVPIAAMFFFSQIKPVFLSRALIYSATPYLLLLAIGLDRLTRWRIGILALVLLLTLNLGSLYRLYSIVPKEAWDQAAAYVTDRAEPGELVLFIAADAQIAFDYYAEGEAVLLERRGLPVDVFAVGPLEPRLTEKDLPRIEKLVGNRRSFWLVDSHSAYADPQGLARGYANERYRLLDVRQFEGVRVKRYAAATVQGAGS